MIGIIGLALAGLLFAVKSLYGENSDMGMVALLTAAVAIVAVIGLSLLALGAAIGGISTSLKGMKMDKAKLITRLIYSLFITILGLVVVLSLGASLIGAVFKGQTANLVITLLFVILGTLFLLTGAMNTMEAVITELAIPLKALSVDKIKRIEVILGTVFIGIAAIMTIMTLGIALIGSIMDGYTWESALPILFMSAGTIVSFILIAEEFQKMAKVLAAITPQKLQYIQSTLLILFVTIAGIMLVIAGGTAAIAANLGGENAATLQSIAPALGIAIGAVKAFVGIASEFEKLAVTMSTIASFNLKNIIATMTAILIITGLMATIMTALMNWMAGNGVGGEQNLMNAAALILTIILPFAALVGIISLMIPIANKFMTAAFEISAGLAAIGAGLFFLAGGIQYLREAFGIGKSVAEGVASGIEDNSKVATDAAKDLMKDVDEAGKEEARISSPSKEFAEDGKYIDQGLAQGIKKNTPLAEKAAVGLAVATNKSFQKELKIASPSKVFYENGKFVIRGFINGANSEMQKQKDLGSAMGEGFAESAKAGMEDAWAGLWDGQEMKDWIENFSKEGGLNFGEEAGKGLFSAFLGEEADDTEIKKQLTADEQKIISDYTNKKNDIDKQIEELYAKKNEAYAKYDEVFAMTPTNADEARAREEKLQSLRKNIEYYNNEITELKSESSKYGEFADKVINKAGGTTKKRTGGIFGGLGDVFDDLGEEFGNIMSSSMLGSLGEWFGENGEGLKEITSVFDTALGEAGDTGANSFISRIFSTFGLNSKTNSFTDMGTLIGSSIGQGIADAIFGPIAEIALRNPIITGIIDGLHFLGIISDDVYKAWHPDMLDKELLHSQNNALIATTMYPKKNNYNISDEDWEYYMDTLRSTFKDTKDLTSSQIEAEFLGLLADPDKKYKTIKKDSKDVYDLLKDKFGSYYTRIENNQTEFNNALNSAIAAGIIHVDEYGMTVGEENIDALVKFIEDWFNISTEKAMARDAFLAKQEAQKLISKKLASSKVDSKDKVSISQILSDFAGDNDIWFFGNSPLSSEIQRELNNVFAAGFDVIDFLMKGFELGFLSWNGKLVELSTGTMSGIITALQEEAEEKSPSKKGIRVGAYLSEGVAIGIEEGSMDAINAASEMMTNATDLINDEVITGLNATQSMLDHDITPSVTPVFDSSQLQNGVDTINSAIDSMSPRVESAIGSFGYESTDYTNNLNALSSRIEGTNSLVNTLIGMLEAGAGINVKVSAEPDPYNLYNLVVEENRTEFKRTGRNNLAY